LTPDAIRRFLMHTLLDGFHRIRHYGLFANGYRADKIKLCRELLAAPSALMNRDTDNCEKVTPAKRLRSLEDENTKLKRLLADAMLDSAALKDLLGKKW
jgi:hypothetical protein